MNMLLILGGVAVVGVGVFFLASQGGGDETDPRSQIPADNSSAERTAIFGAITAVAGATRDIYNGIRTQSGTGSTPKSSGQGPAYDDSDDWAPDWFTQKTSGATSGGTAVPK